MKMHCVVDWNTLNLWSTALKPANNHFHDKNVVHMEFHSQGGDQCECRQILFYFSTSWDHAKQKYNVYNFISTPNKKVTAR